MSAACVLLSLHSEIFKDIMQNPDFFEIYDKILPYQQNQNYAFYFYDVPIQLTHWISWKITFNFY